MKDAAENYAALRSLVAGNIAAQRTIRNESNGELNVEARIYQ